MAASIWEESYSVRLVWITMLAIKDREGFVSSSVPGLARLANVTITECEQALSKFSAPDKYSKCQDFEGVRIKAVDGGWMILGHKRNQEKMRELCAKISNAQRQKRFRDKKKPGIPLAGEQEYTEAIKRGAPQEELDAIVAKHSKQGSNK